MTTKDFLALRSARNEKQPTFRVSFEIPLLPAAMWKAISKSFCFFSTELHMQINSHVTEVTAECLHGTY